MKAGRTFLLVAAVGGVLLAGCRSGPREDPILRLSAAEALTQGKELMAKEKYGQARPYLSHAFDVEPNSPVGREALLLVADAHYLEGGEENFIKAEAKYRDYLNRFPTSDRAAYAQFQVANSLAERMERPDRDQTATREAYQAYQEILRLYPGSEYAAEAREKLRVVTDRLAEHEFMVGRFYLDVIRIPAAAVQRFEYLLENYPDYSDKDKVIYHLGLAYRRSRRPEQSRAAFERLRSEFPDSPYINELPREAVRLGHDAFSEDRDLDRRDPGGSL